MYSTYLIVQTSAPRFNWSCRTAAAHLAAPRGVVGIADGPDPVAEDASMVGEHAVAEEGGGLAQPAMQRWSDSESHEPM